MFVQVVHPPPEGRGVRPARLHGLSDDGAQIERLELHVDLAMCDARKIEEIIDQANQ